MKEVLFNWTLNFENKLLNLTTTRDLQDQSRDLGEVIENIWLYWM